MVRVWMGWMVAVLAVSGCRTHAAVAQDAGGPLQVQSDEVLARTPTTQRARVREILIGWGALESAYRGHMDHRALPRNQDDAAALVLELKRKAEAGESFGKMVSNYSEDPSGADPQKLFDISANGASPPPFQALSLRLNAGEVGIVQSRWGYHLVQRVE